MEASIDLSVSDWRRLEVVVGVLVEGLPKPPVLEVLLALLDEDDSDADEEEEEAPTAAAPTAAPVATPAPPKGEVGRRVVVSLVDAEGGLPNPPVAELELELDGLADDFELDPPPKGLVGREDEDVEERDELEDDREDEDDERELEDREAASAISAATSPKLIQAMAR